MNKEQALALLKPDHTFFYITQIFKNVHEVTPTDQIELRKIGIVTNADGVSTRPFDESIACGIIPQFGLIEDWQSQLAHWTIRRLQMAAAGGVGSFMAPALLTDRRANDESVRAMVSVCADFDTGNPIEKLQAVNTRFGFKPTMVVKSGGTTKEGHPKLHVHWRLMEPCTEPWKIAYIREQIALQFGGDTSFKRIPQVIRIPGALYDKAGAWGVTEIVDADEHAEADIWNFEEVLNIDWENLNPESMWAKRDQANRPLAETKSKSDKSARLKQIQREQIHEGGDGDDNRYQRFNEWAGVQIRNARMQLQTEEEAEESVHLWVQEKMVPPWDYQRVHNEFHQLLQRDKVNNADRWAEHVKPPIVIHNLPTNSTPAVMDTQAQAAINASLAIETFDVGVLYQGAPPPVPFIIENFLMEGSVHGMVADGGVGKTYLGLELAMRVAAGPQLDQNRFLGFDVVQQGMVVVLTVEDSKDDIHRRLNAIDPDGHLRNAAATRCFIIPVQDQLLGGLTLVEKDARGNLRPSVEWQMLLRMIGECRATAEREKLPLFVIIDTYSATHHGDENTSTGTNEWFRAAGLLKQFNAALMIMHHVKKANPDIEIKTPTDMRNNIRGSIAFPNSCRVVYGVWPMPNSDSVMKELPKENEAQLFNMGLLKNNTSIDWSDRSDPRYKEPMITLRRTGSGQLIYDAMIHQTRIELTHGKRERKRAEFAQLRAAVMHSCRWYSENSWALTERLLTKECERFLPSALHDVPTKDIKKAITQLVKEGALKEIKIKARGGTFTVYDTPEGPYAMNKQEDRVKETPVLDWHGYRYDEEHCDYVTRADWENVTSDDVAAPSQGRLDLNGWQPDD